MEFESFTCPCCDGTLTRVQSRGQDFVCKATELGFRDVFRPGEGVYVVVTDNPHVFNAQGRLTYLKRVDDLVVQVQRPLVDIVDQLNCEFPGKEFLLADLSYHGWWARVILFGAVGEVQVLEAHLQAACEGKLWSVSDDSSFNITKQVAQDRYQAIEKHIKEMQ